MGKRTQKQIVRIRAKPPDLEDLNHIKELPVNITNDRHGSRNVDDIALLHQQFFRLGAYRLHHRVCQQLFFIQPFDALVEVDTRCISKLGLLLGRTRTSYPIWDDQGAAEGEDLPGKPGIAGSGDSWIQFYNGTNQCVDRPTILDRRAKDKMFCFEITGCCEIKYLGRGAC